ncbi:hypothetical protein MRS44_018527 [Fusarium solani]|uniref:uncharacterized protein n=1 Tax=Fusarium solani TaxID=169388 RepID=UPI0032C40527|nr:hypothetical protein MRS44_018527 [Fusarium solani]
MPLGALPDQSQDPRDESESQALPEAESGTHPPQPRQVITTTLRRSHRLNPPAAPDSSPPAIRPQQPVSLDAGPAKDDGDGGGVQSGDFVSSASAMMAPRGDDESDRDDGAYDAHQQPDPPSKRRLLEELGEYHRRKRRKIRRSRRLKRRQRIRNNNDSRVEDSGQNQDPRDEPGSQLPSEAGPRGCSPPAAISSRGLLTPTATLEMEVREDSTIHVSNGPPDRLPIAIQPQHIINLDVNPAEDGGNDGYNSPESTLQMAGDITQGRAMPVSDHGAPDSSAITTQAGQPARLDAYPHEDGREGSVISGETEMMALAPTGGNEDSQDNDDDSGDNGIDGAHQQPHSPSKRQPGDGAKRKCQRQELGEHDIQEILAEIEVVTQGAGKLEGTKESRERAEKAKKAEMALEEEIRIRKGQQRKFTEHIGTLTEEIGKLTKRIGKLTAHIEMLRRQTEEGKGELERQEEELHEKRKETISAKRKVAELWRQE